MVANRTQSTSKKCCLTLAQFSAAGVALFALSNSALALDIAAGPIWNNADAQAKCPIAAQVYNVPWNGHWRTTIPGQMSVCGTDATSLPPISLPANIQAGPIWNNDDAKVKCPVVAAAARGVWNGQWRTTVPGKMSVCGLNAGPKQEW